jgi:hypothetical protein
VFDGDREKARGCVRALEREREREGTR